MIWWALAIIAFVLELFSGTFYLLVLSLAFLLTGVFNALFLPSDAINILICAILATIGIVIVATLQRRKKIIFQSQNTQYDDLDLGQTVLIAHNDGNGIYRVHYRGALWQAQSDCATLSEQTRATIVARHGNILNIQPIEGA